MKKKGNHEVRESRHEATRIRVLQVWRILAFWLNSIRRWPILNIETQHDFRTFWKDFLTTRNTPLSLPQCVSIHTLNMSALQCATATYDDRPLP